MALKHKFVLTKWDGKHIVKIWENGKLKVRKVPKGENPEEFFEYVKSQYIPPKPLCEKFSEYLEARSNELRPSVIHQYKNTLNRFLRWLESENIEEPTKADARRYVSTWEVNNTTKSIKITQLKTAFNYLLENEEVKENPFNGVKRPMISPKRNIPFSAKQREEIYREAKKVSDDLVLYIDLLYNCFLRPIEIQRLEFQDIDIVSGLITIPSNKSKNKRTESVEIPDHLWEKLKRLKGEKIKGKVVLLKAQQANVIHRKILLKTDDFIDGQCLYSWKHCGVIEACRRNIPIAGIMQQCRHSNLKTTTIYIRNLGVMDRQRVFQSFSF